MRLFATLFGDIHYQIKYGFYFLYTFISTIYIIILILCPIEYKQKVASIIILTDPVTLGIFFIGGIWLLEKGEGIHGFWIISPLHPIEYILSKSISLSIISTFSAMIIIIIGLQKNSNYLFLAGSIFIGSMTFTTIGLYISSFAKTVNHYMLIVTPVATILTLPPILATFGIFHSLFDILPSMALWRIIIAIMNRKDISIIWLLVLLVWLFISLYITSIRIPNAMQIDAGGKI